jgi:hypothetical protein
MKPVPLGNVSNVDAADPVYKLTLDSKNEVTIDPRVTGLEGRDEMGVLDYVKRESYLTTFNWTSNENPGDMLWNCRVAPDLFRSVNYTTPTLRRELHMTPMCHMSQLFKYWQGSIKFRFQIVKSAYHKGRMLVRYDPRSLGATVDYNTNYSRVIDIAEAEDFEVIVGWGQHQPWLECEELDNTVNFSPSIRLSELFMRATNGVIELDVINELVSPSASSDISVNVYVSMIDDAKFAQPDGEKIKDLTYFRHPQEETLNSQSGLVEQDGVDEPLAATQLETIAGEAEMTDQTMNVFFGENITSIRELVKRYVMTRYWYTSHNAGSGSKVLKLDNKVFPYQRGYDSEGIDSEQFGSYTHSNMNPINYFQSCYAGYRGSLRHKYLYHTGGAMLNPVVQRENYSPDTAGIWTITSLSGADTNSRNLTKSFTNTTWQGSSGTGVMINNAIEVEFPFYNKGRIGYPRLIKAQDMDCPSTTSHFVTGVDTAPRDGANVKIAFQQWTAAGEDFSFYFFTGVPIMYQYSE